MSTRAGRLAVVCALSLQCLGAQAANQGRKQTGKIPITTSSTEARAHYLKGRDLLERLRATDARKEYEAAVAKDDHFALAYLGLANTAPTNKAALQGMNRAVALAGSVSPGERLMIQGLEATIKGNPAQVKDAYTKLVKAYPNDERAHMLLGTYYFAQQQWDLAIRELDKAVKINPEFSAPLNQLGYAYRFQEKYDRAEKTFKRYTKLIPDDPNPYDSYGELLMKMGKLDESIASYRKALAVDPNFVASYVGIANDQMFKGELGEARKTLALLSQKARTDGERRQALFWTAQSYIHEGATDKALAEAQKEAAIAEADGDLGNLAADNAFMGNILVEAGRPDEAATRFAKQLAIIDRANVPAEVKETAHRIALFNDARVALARKDLAAAKAKAKAYAARVGVEKRRFEVLLQHELAGRIAIAEHRFAAAVAELQQANRQDPRALYYLAVALKGKGDLKMARAAATRAAHFNGLSANLAYVRNKALALLSGS